MRQKVFKIYHHKVTDIKPKIEVFEYRDWENTDLQNSHIKLYNDTKDTIRYTVVS